MYRGNGHQLFLNFFMLVCILVIVFCIGLLRNREKETDSDIRNFVSSIADVEAAAEIYGKGICLEEYLGRVER